MTPLDSLASVGYSIGSADLLVSLYVIRIAVDFSHLLARVVVRMSSEELDLMGGTEIWLGPES